MADAPVVCDSAAPDSQVGGRLFEGKTFWFSARVPLRGHFKQMVQANGGIVASTEKDADFRISDHLAKDPIPGALSFKYIEQSIRNGQLEDPHKHQIGGAIDGGGANKPATRVSKTPFTEEDDRLLWRYVDKCEREKRGTTGRAIYKDLADQNDRHTWQSWRDRWVKILRRRARPAFLSDPIEQEGPPSQNGTPRHESVVRSSMETSGQDRGVDDRRSSQQKKVKSVTPQTNVSRSRRDGDNDEADEDGEPNEDVDDESDIADLLTQASDILRIHPCNVEEAWESWANHFPKRTAQQWQILFQKRVLPLYMSKQKNPFQLALQRGDHAEQQDDLRSINVDQPSSPQSDKLKQMLSPERSHPESPRIRSNPTSKSLRVQVVIQRPRNGLAQEKSQPKLKDRMSSPAMISPSRPSKRRKVADNVDETQIPTRIGPQMDLRQNVENGNGEGREIPSTPDRPKQRTSVSTPKSTPRILKRSPADSFLVDQDDTEEEVGATPIGGRVASVTLSEPTLTPTAIRTDNRVRGSPYPQALHRKEDTVYAVVEETQYETAPTDLFETAPTHPLDDDDLNFLSHGSNASVAESVDNSVDAALEAQLQNDQSFLNMEDHQPLDTQASLAEEPQIVDLTFSKPEAEDDYDLTEADHSPPPSSSSSSSSSSPSPSPSHPASSHPQSSFQPSPPASTGSGSSNAGNDHDDGAGDADSPPAVPPKYLTVTDWIAAQVSSKKVSEHQVHAAILSTSMDPTLAGKVLEYVQRGESVPALRGVWTENDDRDLRSEDVDRLKRLVRKHGEELFRIRSEFLVQWDQA